jgi:uncharacterized membrane protein
MLATVIWIGGLSMMVIVILPAAQKALPSAEFGAFVENVQRRLDPLAWFCLILLALTGMFQMSANPNYAGFMAIHNPWAVALLLKHGLFGGMILLGGLLTWGVLPALRRMNLRQQQGLPAEAQAKLLQRQTRLLRINFLLAVLILLLTAVARTS